MKPLRQSQLDVVERLDKDMSVKDIAADLGVTRNVVEQRIMHMLVSGVLVRVRRGQYRRKGKAGNTQRILLPVTYNPKVLTEQDYNAIVESALSSLNRYWSEGYETMTQQIYNADSGKQMLYVLHKAD